MNLRTYRAFTLQQALDAVREDLGPGAVILRTTTSRQGGFMGLGARTVVEVTASDAAEPPVFRTSPPTPARRSTPPPKPAPRPRAAASERSPEDVAPAIESAALAEPVRAVKPPPDDRRRPQPPVTPTVVAPFAAESPALDLEEERRRTRALARRMLADHERRAKERTTASAPAAAPPPPVAAPPPPAAAPPPPVAAPPPPVAAPPPVVAAPAPPSAVEPSGGRVGRPPARVRDEELEAIGGLVGDVLRGRHRRSPLPPEFFARELALLAGEMGREFAEGVIDDAVASVPADAMDDPATVGESVRRQLAARVPVAETALPARSPDARPLTVAFVGPTGVGKTTSVAKLAAALRLRHRLSVGLITADTYRIAAVDQLRTYADIIGVPLRVAMDAAAMRRATLELADRDVILIDTAGRSQRDERRIDELRAMVEAADPHEVHLVLSAIAGPRALRREAAAFSAVGTDKLVLTKLDEAVSFGMLIEAVAGIGLPLSFLTTGQEVPDDLERATATRLADLALEDPSGGVAGDQGRAGAETGSGHSEDGGPR